MSRGRQQKITPNQAFMARKSLMGALSKIPKKNRKKFVEDFIDLISRAQKEDYGA